MIAPKIWIKRLLLWVVILTKSINYFSQISKKAKLLHFSRREALLLCGSAFSFSLLTRPLYAQSRLSVSNLIHSVFKEKKEFDRSKLFDLARSLSQRPFEDDDSFLPSELKNLPLNAYNQIQPSSDGLIWGKEERVIGIRPLHRGSIFSQRVDIFLIEDGLVNNLNYSRSYFNFNRLNMPVLNQDIGFSGFQILFSENGTHPSPFAEFQGATFFKGKANNQVFGSSSKLLMVRPANQRDEEFPFFRAFWIERPISGEPSITCHALVDSPSCVALARFTMRPGIIALSDIELSIFPRETMDSIGIGGFGSTYLYGETRRSVKDDLRPAVHKADSLRIHNGKGEWILRSLNNPNSLQISSFIDNNLQGFGFIQHSRDFEDFMDEKNSYEHQPTSWIEPLESWGEGSVQLIEIPNDSEMNENVIAFWEPKQTLEPGNEYLFSYRLYWSWDTPKQIPFAQIASCRVGTSQADSKFREIIVDYKPVTSNQENLSCLKPFISNDSGIISNVSQTYLNNQGLLRIRFNFNPENSKSTEFRLVLKMDSTIASETWLYRWTI